MSDNLQDNLRFTRRVRANSSPSSSTLSLRRYLIRRIEKTLQEIILEQKNQREGCYSTSFERSEAQGNWLLSLQDIPVNRERGSDYVCYVSAAASKYSKALKLPSSELAHRLLARLTESLELREAFAEELSHDGDDLSFRAQIPFPGWISFLFSDRTVGFWLQSLIDCYPIMASNQNTEMPPLKMSTNRNQNLRNLTTISEIQYVYARCCSLLYIAHENEQLLLANHPFPNNPRNAAIIQPISFPYLQENEMLRLKHSSEKQLIGGLMDAIDTLDRIADIPNCDKDWMKVLQAGRELAASFQQFHAQCRILGDVWRSNPEQSLARLGLVAATRSVLRVLLEDGLQAIAPTEL